MWQTCKLYLQQFNIISPPQAENFGISKVVNEIFIKENNKFEA